MTTKTEHLLYLQSQRARKQHLEVTLQDYYEQKAALEQKVAARKAALKKEQEDVDKLEQSTLSGLLYQLMGKGKKEKKLTKEKKEAKEAFLKYSSATRDLKSLEFNIQIHATELENLKHIDAQYDAALQDILEDLKTSGSPDGIRVLVHQQNIGQITAEIRELDEAIAAGRAALTTTKSILYHLSKAEEWGTWDLLGGGLYTDLAKHDALDSAQKGVEKLQVQLRSFRSELADVTIDAEIKVTIDGFLGFADFFFDGLFADWVVMDEIGKAVRRVTKTADDISNVLSALEAGKAAAQRELQALRKALETLALQS